MKLIDGKQISATLKEQLAEQVKTFPEKYGRVPHLAHIYGPRHVHQRGKCSVQYTLCSSK